MDSVEREWNARAKGQTLDGRPLEPGVNVDPVNIGAGLRVASHLGYDDVAGQMVATYALQRWARGEEAGAEATWLSYYPRDLTSFRAILAAAIAGSNR